MDIKNTLYEKNAVTRSELQKKMLSLVQNYMLYERSILLGAETAV